MCGGPFVSRYRIGVMNGHNYYLCICMGFLMLEAVMIGEFLRSPFEIQNLFEFAWSLFGTSSCVVLNIFQGLGILCIWLIRFEFLLV